MNAKTCKCERMLETCGKDFPHRYTWECDEFLEPVRPAFKPYGNYFSWEAHNAGVPSVGEIP